MKKFARALVVSGSAAGFLSAWTVSFGFGVLESDLDWVFGIEDSSTSVSVSSVSYSESEKKHIKKTCLI